MNTDDADCEILICVHLCSSVAKFLMSDAKTIDWAALRKDFPILDQEVHGKPLVYFDNAATSQKPRAVIDALVHYYEHDNANVHRGIHELSNRSTNAFEAARTRAAKFINAKSADEIIFTRGTTEGINLVASSWGAKNLESRRRDSAHRNGASQQSCAVAIARATHRREDRLHSRHRRRRHFGFVQAGFAAHAAGEISFDGSHFQFDGHGESGRGNLCAGKKARHHHARGRRAERRASAGGRAGHRLRFLCVLRPQNLRADRHRRFVGTAGNCSTPCRRIRAAAK